MRIARVIFVAAITAIVLQPTVARSSERRLPDAVTSQISELKRICEGPGHATDGHETVKRGDLNGDGITDYVFYVGDYKCPGAWSVFAPTAATGATAILFLGTRDGGVTQVWSGDVWGTQIKRVRGVQTLVVDTAGLGCTDKPARDIASMERCKRRVVFNVKTTKWEMIQ